METIYVKLENEGTLVWRPVEASKGPDGTFTISNDEVVADEESWEFAPGQKVMCKWKTVAGEKPVLVAYEPA